ncbi:hypothetical protein VTL71DRAFT_10135 [Oculimacula yallundae]|uniref:Extracellular membrane protein CFEM domain-containing protein n=1 Tax=Oculimacula yallundae TaxID=86028 RepID=A0ABR4BR63_9HELO
MKLYQFFFFLLGSTITAQVAAVKLKTPSLANTYNHLIRQSCIKDCLLSLEKWMGSLGCAELNGFCYCNTNIASSAISHLSSCVINHCSSELDALAIAAVEVYGKYCFRAGYPTPETDFAIQTAIQNTRPPDDGATPMILTLVTITLTLPSNSVKQKAPLEARAKTMSYASYEYAPVTTIPFEAPVSIIGNTAEDTDTAGKSDPGKSDGSNTGNIIGIVFGVVTTIGVVVAIFMCLCR